MEKRRGREEESCSFLPKEGEQAERYGTCIHHAYLHSQTTSSEPVNETRAKSANCEGRIYGNADICAHLRRTHCASVLFRRAELISRDAR